MNATNFVALVGREYVESADGLDELLALLDAIADPTVPEDVAVWRGGRLVVVVRPDGSRVWVRPARRTDAVA
jgi:hypothetical protein